VINVKLCVVHGRPQGKSFLFPRGEYYFGRGPECDIQPDSDWVSRQHCMLRIDPETVSIRDLGSRNGTLVNGERVMGERQLAHGDRLQIGPLMFEVQLDDIPYAQVAPEEAQSDTTPTVSNLDFRDTAEQPAAAPAAPPPPKVTSPK
jgi:pSer/pThr/pTyr-binding forkhead associated (FHA) protein